MTRPATGRKTGPDDGIDINDAGTRQNKGLSTKKLLNFKTEECLIKLCVTSLTR
jgi:hypothetical protein